MAWQEVETDLGAGGAGRVKYSVRLKHGGARISVPAALVAKLGWTEQTRFRLLVGSADLEGKLRIEPKDGGAISGKTPPKGGGSLTLRLGRWPLLAPRDVDAVKVDSEIHDDALTIRLPDHARVAAPAPRPATAPALASVSGQTKVSVNDRFFNDPKPPKVAMAAGTRK